MKHYMAARQSKLSRNNEFIRKSKIYIIEFVLRHLPSSWLKSGVWIWFMNSWKSIRPSRFLSFSLNTCSLIRSISSALSWRSLFGPPGPYNLSSSFINKALTSSASQAPLPSTSVRNLHKRNLFSCHRYLHHIRSTAETDGSMWRSFNPVIS